MDRNILYIDSDQSAQEAFSEVMEEKDELSLETAASVDEAVSILESSEIKCIVTETGLPDGDISDVLELTSNQDPTPVPILFTRKDFNDIATEEMVSFNAYISKDNEDAYRKAADEIESLLESRASIDYPVPEDEEKRLEALEKFDIDSLLDSGDFDRLAELGAELFDARWCFLGLVTDERERFLSFQGSDTEELERSCTICTFAINEDDVMVVEDRDKDPRFKYVDELDDLGIKWYAGAPVVDKEGYKIGAFCVADTENRDFSEHDRKMLKLLADESMDKIRLEKQASETLVDKLRKML